MDVLSAMGIGCGAFCLGGCGWMSWMGFFHKPKARDGYFPGAHHFLYVEVQANPKVLKPAAIEFLKNVRDNRVLNPSGNKWIDFGCRFHSISYDDPARLANPDDFRMVFGLDFEENLTEDMATKIVEADESGTLKMAKLPMSKCSRASFPYRNELTHVVKLKTYPVLLAHMYQKDRLKEGSVFIERIDWHFGKIEFFAGFEEET